MVRVAVGVDAMLVVPKSLCAGVPWFVWSGCVPKLRFILLGQYQLLNRPSSKATEGYRKKGKKNRQTNKENATKRGLPCKINENPSKLVDKGP